MKSVEEFLNKEDVIDEKSKEIEFSDKDFFHEVNSEYLAINPEFKQANKYKYIRSIIYIIIIAIFAGVLLLLYNHMILKINSNLYILAGIHYIYYILLLYFIYRHMFKFKIKERKQQLNQGSIDNLMNEGYMIINYNGLSIFNHEKQLYKKFIWHNLAKVYIEDNIIYIIGNDIGLNNAYLNETTRNYFKIPFCLKYVNLILKYSRCEKLEDISNINKTYFEKEKD